MIISSDLWVQTRLLKTRQKEEECISETHIYQIVDEECYNKSYNILVMHLIECLLDKEIKLDTDQLLNNGLMDGVHCAL